MRKNYIYAVTLVLLALAVSLGCYFYMNHRTVEYKYGTFVQLPSQLTDGEWELCA